MSSAPKQDWNDAREVHCSRERSRAAWKIIEEVSIQHLILMVMAFTSTHRYDHLYDMKLNRTKSEHFYLDAVSNALCG